MGCAHKISTNLAFWPQAVVETVSFRIRSTVHALGTLSLFTLTFFFFVGTLSSSEPIAGLILLTIFFRRPIGFWISRAKKGVTNSFSSCQVNLKLDILLVHFLIEGSGIGSHCIKEEEVSIQCPLFYFGPRRSTNWHNIHHINASFHVTIVDQRLRFLPLVFLIHASRRTLLSEPTQSLFQSSCCLHRRSRAFCYCSTISLISIHIQDHPLEQLLSFPLVFPSYQTSGFWWLWCSSQETIAVFTKYSVYLSVPVT